MKKFLLGVALGAVIATAFRLRIEVTPDAKPKSNEPESSSGDRFKDLASKVDAYAADPTRQRRMAAALGMMSTLAEMRSLIERLKGDNATEDSEPQMHVKTLTGDAALDFLDDNPEIKDQLMAMGAKLPARTTAPTAADTEN